MFISQITSLAASLSLDQHGVRRIRAVCLHALNMLTILEPLNDLRSPRRHKNHIQKFKFGKKKKQQRQFFAFFFLNNTEKIMVWHIMVVSQRA